MTIDIAAVTHIARLARMKLPEEDRQLLVTQMNNVLDYVKQLNEVNVDHVAPMTGCQDMALRWREDIVNDGGQPEAILAGAPARAADFFKVPKVLE